MASGGSVDKVGEFTINFSDILGFGSFGVVTTGTDANGKPVAAKRILLVDERKARKVSEELDRLKTLDHQNIVKIFEVDRQQKVLWIIMECCQYGDLDHFFLKRRLTDKQKFEMMHQIGMGVQYLHSKDIIHRDIKPANILVAQEDPVVVKLTDFDCSKFLDPHFVTSCMSTNVGTPAFKAPEFFKRIKVGDKNKIVYHRNIDIYAAGLTFLAMIQGNEHLAPRIEADDDEFEPFKPIGQQIAERIKYKKNPLEILRFPRLSGIEQEPLSGEDERIQRLRELIREMTRAEPTDRISAKQVVKKMQQILEKIPREVNIKLVMTAGTGLCRWYSTSLIVMPTDHMDIRGPSSWYRTRFAVTQTGHMVFWGKSSRISPYALHIFIKSPEGLEKVREEKGFCEHDNVYLTPFRSEFLAVFCGFCKKMRLYNIITTEVTTAFHNERLVPITRVAAAEEGEMYVSYGSYYYYSEGLLKLNTEQIPFTVTQTIKFESASLFWNMIHIPAPYNLLVFSDNRYVSDDVWAVSCDSREKRWKYSGDREDRFSSSWVMCYSKEHEVLLVADRYRIRVLDPEDGSLIHTVDLGDEFFIIMDLHIHDETLIVYHTSSEEGKVSFFALEWKPIHTK